MNYVQNIKQYKKLIKSSLISLESGFISSKSSKNPDSKHLFTRSHSVVYFYVLELQFLNHLFQSVQLQFLMFWEGQIVKKEMSWCFPFVKIRNKRIHIIH